MCKVLRHFIEQFGATSYKAVPKPTALSCSCAHLLPAQTSRQQGEAWAATSQVAFSPPPPGRPGI
eukprot:6194195-Pleurochrysis_carterae.AAC.2